MKKYLLLFALGVCLTIPNQANASLILSSSPVPTDQGTILSNNDFKSDLNALGYNSILSGKIEATSAGTVYFYYHGQESGWDNSFIAKNQDDTVAVSYTESSGSTAWSAGGTLLGSMSVANGDVLKLFFDSNVGAEHAIGHAGFGIFSKTSLTSFNNSDLFAANGHIYFGHDDDGAGPDDNHDDIMISARFVAVPEPMSAIAWLGLFGTASVFSGRRRQSRA